MPCQDGGPSEPQVSESAYIKLKARLDEVTQNLCFICGNLVKNNQLDLANPRILKWWEEHQEHDRKRVNERIDEYLKKKTIYRESPIKLVNLLISIAEEVHPVSSYHREWFKTMVDQGLDRFKEKQRKNKEKKDRINAAKSKLTDEEKKLLKIS